MADAGRILIMPKGDYNPSVSYEMLDLVAHNDIAWLAKKDVIGIEPSEANTEHWFKLASSPVGAIDDIINGTTPVGDSKKLNGLEASEFVQSMGNGGIRFRMVYGDHNYLSTIDNTIPSVPAVANYAHIFATNSDGVIVSALSIGTDYTTNIYEYSSANGKWEQVAKSADLANYLSINGGTLATYLCITGGYGVLSGDQNHTQIQSRVSISAEQGRRGFLVCNTNASPTVADALRLRDIKPDGTETDYAVLHTGNSAKVIVSSTPLTPADAGSVRVW